MESLLFILNLIIVCGLCYRAYQIDNVDIAAQKHQAKAAQQAMLDAKLQSHRAPLSLRSSHAATPENATTTQIQHNVQQQHLKPFTSSPAVVADAVKKSNSRGSDRA